MTGQDGPALAVTVTFADEQFDDVVVDVLALGCSPSAPMNCHHTLLSPGMGEARLIRLMRQGRRQDIFFLFGSDKGGPSFRSATATRGPLFLRFWVWQGVDSLPSLSMSMSLCGGSDLMDLDPVRDRNRKWKWKWKCS